MTRDLARVASRRARTAPFSLEEREDLVDPDGRSL